MTREEAEALIKAQPGVCVGVTYWGDPYHYKYVGYYQWWDDKEGQWWGALALPSGTYTRVKDPLLCQRSEDSPWQTNEKR